MRRIELLFAAALIAAGVASVALQRWVFVDPTEPQDWRRGAAWVTQRIDEGDVFRIEPWWYERALTHFVPIGAQADRIRDPLLEDVYRHEDIFIVSQKSRLDRALANLPFEPEIAERADFDTVSAVRFAAPQNAFSWELLDHLEDASVGRVLGGDIERCNNWDPRRRRWNCGKPSRWLYVGEALREVGDDPRRCVWAHPLDRGRTLRIESTVPESDTIRIRGSFDLRAARLPREGEVLMQVFVDDALVHERRVAHDDDAWTPHDIDVSDKNGPVKLRVEVDLIGSIKDRYYCLNAWAR